MLAFDGAEPADAGRDEDADTRGVVGRDLEVGALHREVRRGHGVLDEGVHLLDVLLVDVVQGVEALDFARDLTGELRDVEPRDTADAAASGAERVPVGFGADPEG